MVYSGIFADIIAHVWTFDKSTQLSPGCSQLTRIQSNHREDLITGRSRSCIVITLYCHVVQGPRLQTRHYPSRYTANGDLDANGITWYNKMSIRIEKYSFYPRTTPDVDLKIKYLFKCLKKVYGGISHQCNPWVQFQRSAICGLSFLMVLDLIRGYFLRIIRFSSLQHLWIPIRSDWGFPLYWLIDWLIDRSIDWLID